MGGEKAVKIYAPDWYPQFRCAAGACGHTCCAGWEIGIDPDSLRRYQGMGGELGEKLRRCIVLSEEPHFLLEEGERCPFLTEENLCELILREGESSLCQICRDHPRFRNYWSDRMEVGLGLACEEAARLALTSDHPLRLICLPEEAAEPEEVPAGEEKALLAFRNRMLAEVDESGPPARLKEYLIYRHLADALYDGLLENRIRLVRRAYEAIMAGWDGKNLPDLLERARRFSNETEYDEDKLREMLR